MASDAARKAAKEARRVGADFKSDFDHVISRGKDTADDLKEKIHGAVEDAAASGRDIAEEYVQRRRKHLSRAAERVSAYADDNTAAVAIGAFAAGLLAGYIACRR